ncbi:hypothetical protein C1H46_013396 [Malus baccata]|uniref:Uncharacterized protein n=1 Tax=Malus baccata TaxID=106549 RepID=A0A540MPY0_MALBA|nr:hypothetical protein C1H46_013396 [Malus baccata]
MRCSGFYGISSLVQKQLQQMVRADAGVGGSQAVLVHASRSRRVRVLMKRCGADEGGVATGG